MASLSGSEVGAQSGGAGASPQFLGGIVGPILDFIGGQEERATQRTVLERQQEFQERMSSTAVQRHASDMEKAGLNRILAAGGQASSPAGATFVPKNLMKGLGEQAVTTALDIRRMKKDVEEAASRISLQNAQTKKVVAETVGPSNRAEVERLHPKFFGWFDAIMDRMGPAALGLGGFGMGRGLGALGRFKGFKRPGGTGSEWYKGGSKK